MKSTAADVRRRVLRSENRFWHVDDFGGEPHAVAMALGRLLETGELERLRRGVYWRGGDTHFGRQRPEAVRTLREVAGDREAVGAAGWYATNLLGLSTQVAPRPVVSITGRPPTGLRGIEVINRAARTGRRDAHLNETEVTVLEALEGWDKYVEVDSKKALDRFAQLLDAEEVRIDRLVRAAKTESPVVRERLRAILVRVGAEEAASTIPRARSEASRKRALRVIATDG